MSHKDDGNKPPKEINGWNFWLANEVRNTRVITSHSWLVGCTCVDECIKTQESLYKLLDHFTQDEAERLYHAEIFCLIVLREQLGKYQEVSFAFYKEKTKVRQHAAQMTRFIERNFWMSAFTDPANSDDLAERDNGLEYWAKLIVKDRIN